MNQTAEERTIDLPGIPAPPPTAKKTRNTVKRRAEALRDVALTGKMSIAGVHPNDLLEVLHHLGIEGTGWTTTRLKIEIITGEASPVITTE